MFLTPELMNLWNYKSKLFVCNLFWKTAVITATRRQLLLQLYIKCIKLKSKDAVSSNFIFRLGELHTVFAALKVIRKYITSNDIDTCLVKARIYGPNTVDQIKDGLLTRSGLEADKIYLSLYNMVIARFFENNLTLTCIFKQRRKISR